MIMLLKSSSKFNDDLLNNNIMQNRNKICNKYGNMAKRQSVNMQNLHIPFSVCRIYTIICKICKIIVCKICNKICKKYYDNMAI